MIKVPKSRANLVLRFVQDEDVTVKEAFAHIYHWYMAERYFYKMTCAHRKHMKHANRIREDLRVLNFRKDLNEHL